ncbi:hypothetical protein TOPH_08371 [Tolypocladium ophioglossoides CBS 100239]|uniref:Glyoxalase-like domain-containing protein n=1 Tax=Tolypocladium ophioglossoides (strain CBS 100239) TaxID=1163406 RepID=A0A0L0MYS2_TOLOC|nr:hypothetical protein TOPH_08371 [Tolypocladium ophioglossoides CBS 100239]
MFSHADARPSLDHIVILVSHATLVGLPDRLKASFIVAPGGTHADGLTSNRLILFEDGVYIELIAFFDDIDPDRRKRHRWGQLKEGAVIDWAYTLRHESDFAAVQQRVDNAQAGFTYGDPVSGGRTKPDGTVLKWAVAVARNAQGNASGPGSLPFWCLDRTDRQLRVPYEKDHQQTQHPCGARGVSWLALSVPEQEVAALGRVYDAIHHQSSSASGSSQGWHFDVPARLLGVVVVLLGETVAQQRLRTGPSDIHLPIAGLRFWPASSYQAVTQLPAIYWPIHLRQPRSKLRKLLSTVVTPSKHSLLYCDRAPRPPHRRSPRAKRAEFEMPHDAADHDETSTNPGGDVEMAEETGAAEMEQTADGHELPFAGEDAIPPRVSFASYMSSPIVNLLVGQGENQTLLSVHQALLVKSPFFEACCQGFVDDGSPRQIELPDDDITAVGCFLEFLYTGEYFPKKIPGQRVLESDPSLPAVDDSGSHLLKHARLYTLAEKFGMSTLKSLASSKIHCVNSTAKGEIVYARYVYSHTRNEDTTVRAPIASFWATRSHTLRSEAEAEFKALCLEHPQFGYDVLSRVLDDKLRRERNEKMHPATHSGRKRARHSSGGTQ